MNNIATILMSQELKNAVQRLSNNRAVFDTRMLVRYGKYNDKKSVKCKKASAYYITKDGVKLLSSKHKLVSNGYKKNYTVNDIKIVIGAGGQRRVLLKRFGIPGSKMAMWCMDSPISKFWEGKVKRLARELGVRESNAVDIYI